MKNISISSLQIVFILTKYFIYMCVWGYVYQFECIMGIYYRKEGNTFEGEQKFTDTEIYRIEFYLDVVPDVARFTFKGAGERTFRQMKFKWKLV